MGRVIPFHKEVAEFEVAAPLGLQGSSVWQGFNSRQWACFLVRLMADEATLTTVG